MRVFITLLLCNLIALGWLIMDQPIAGPPSVVPMLPSVPSQTATHATEVWLWRGTHSSEVFTL